MKAPGSRASVIANLLQQRPKGFASWEYPVWGHPFSSGVFPLGVVANEHFFPLGTAFCISELGIVASALHVVHEAFGYHPNGHALRQMRPFPSPFTLTNIGLSVLQQRPPENGRLGLVLRPLEYCDGAPPADLIFGSPALEPGFPLLPLPLRFALPRIGAKVICLGYGKMKFPETGIPLAGIADGTFDWSHDANLQLRAMEGRVTHLFVQRFATGYLEGACIALDCEAEPGQSGGPVLDESGHVCGIISASANSWFSSPASLVSLLFPTLMTNIRFGAQIGPMRINGQQPLINLIGTGAVVTDGSESLVHIRGEEDCWHLGPMMLKEEAEADAASTYDDYAGYQSGLRAGAEQNPSVFRFVRHATDNSSTDVS